MSEQKTSFLFKIIKRTVKLFYPEITVEGMENLPDEPVIVYTDRYWKRTDKRQ